MFWLFSAVADDLLRAVAAAYLRKFFPWRNPSATLHGRRIAFFRVV